MNALGMVPFLWMQAAPTPSPSSALALLALRRWCASLTLSSPDPLPRSFGLWAWLGGLVALLIVAFIMQRPLQALKQLFDVPGHARLISSAFTRLRSAGRLVAVICGVTVVVWTASQSVSYGNALGSEDLRALLKSKSPVEVAVEQGILAGLTPMRDLFGLGDIVLLLVVAATLVFRHSAERWGGVMGPEPGPQSPITGWTTFCWGGAWLYALYRLAAFFDPGELPLGGCLFVEAAVVPLLMAVADGLLLAWVLIELRNAGLSELGGERLDISGAMGLVPAATLACVAALPARYLGTGVLLSFLHVPAYVNGVPLWAYDRLAWGLVGVQGAALTTVGLAGAAAWSRGTLRGTVLGYVRLLSTEGGHLTALLALGGLAAGTSAALAYALVLALPVEPWVLSAADSYAHYATLPVGLVTLSALVELGEHSLPLAKLVEPDAAETRSA